MKMKKSLGILLSVLLAAFLVAACTPAAPAPEKPAAPAASKPAEAKPAEAKPAAPKPAESKPAEAKPAEAKPAAAPFKVRYTTIGGRGSMPMNMFKKFGLDKKYNVDLQLEIPANTDAMHTAMIGGATDVIVTGWTNAVTYRTRGVPLVAIYPANSFTYDVLVPKDSPLKSFADLKGKRIGTFASPASVTTVLWRAEVMQFYGFDPFKDAKVQSGAATLLIELLRKGEIDAALLLDPQVTKALASGDFRSIGELGEIWEKNTGETLLATTIVTNEDFLKKNPEGLRNLLRALKESYEILANDNSVWPEMAKEQFKLETPAEIDLIRTRNQKTFVTQWDDKKIEQQIKFGELAVKLFGTEFLPSVPREAFSAAVAP